MRSTRWVFTLAASLLLPLTAAVASTTPAAAATPVVQTAPGVATDVATDVARLSLNAGADERGRRRVELGVQFHGTWGSYTDADRQKVLSRLAAMGAEWVRIDIGWTMMQPEAGRIDPSSWGVQNIDKVITMAHNHGLKVLGTLWLTPEWANNRRGERVGPNDPSDYGRALAWAAAHWKGKVQAWEVWNEPNSGDFLVGANPVEYTRLLCAGYRAVQNEPRADGVRIVYGGPMHNDTPWIERTYRAGVKGCYDVMAVHPYQVPSGKSPRYGDGSDVWEFEHLRALRQLMKRYNDNSPVWATEMGWSSHQNHGGEEAWNTGVTQKQQARYSTMAMRMIQKRYRFVKKVFFYNERSVTGSGEHMAGYGIMTRDLRPKPVYWALQRWAKP